MATLKKRPRGAERPDWCIYCRRAADTKDHVPPKLVLETPRPFDHPTVPACFACNNGFSKDEEYFLTVLAMTSAAPSLIARVREGGKVDRALKRSPAFAERIERQAVVTPGGKVGLQPEQARVNRVIAKIAVGLSHVRGKRVSIEDVAVLTYPLSPPNPVPDSIKSLAYTEKFRPRRWRVIQPGVFSYLWIPKSFVPPCYLMDFHGSLWALAVIGPRFHSLWRGIT